MLFFRTKSEDQEISKKLIKISEIRELLEILHKKKDTILT